MSEDEFVRTGIPGVDEILGGKGLLRGNAIFVIGSPGSGKTTFGLQFLSEGARQFGEHGVYVTLDEDIRYVRANARRLGLDLVSLEKDGKLALVDASPMVVVAGYEVRKRELTTGSLMDMIKKEAKRVNARRLVIDPLVSLTLMFPDEIERRAALLDLLAAVVETGCTSLLITELSESSFDRRYQFEEYLAQGVVIMRKVERPNGVVGIFRVEKMRGLSHDDQPRPYKIGQGGIKVYPTEQTF